MLEIFNGKIEEEFREISVESTFVKKEKSKEQIMIDSIKKMIREAERSVEDLIEESEMEVSINTSWTGDEDTVTSFITVDTSDYISKLFQNLLKDSEKLHTYNDLSSFKRKVDNFHKITCGNGKRFSESIMWKNVLNDTGFMIKYHYEFLISDLQFMLINTVGGIVKNLNKFINNNMFHTRG